MTTLTDPRRRSAAELFEEQALAAAPTQFPTDTTVIFAIVARVDGELVQLVTTAGRNDRREWFELLGLPVSFVDDVDADYGVTLVDERGVTHTAGTNLVFAERAHRHAMRYANPAKSDLLHEGEANAKTTFAFSAESTDGEIGDVAHQVTSAEWPLVLELYGLVDTTQRPLPVPLGLAWCTDDGVTVVTGNSQHHRLEAFCAANGWYAN